MEIVELHFESIDSTNAYAKRELHSFAKNKLICITADEQSAGRGRYQRKWISPKGVNLYVTFCFALTQPIPDLSCLAEIMAYSFSHLLLEDGLHPKIKWPNDVQLNGKKVSGILSEIVFEGSLVFVILGIGINVNMEKTDLDQIDQPATSLKAEMGHAMDRQMLLKRLQKQFEADLDRFKKNGFTPFHSEIEHLLAYKGEPIRCFDGVKEWQGICHSLTADGRLNLLLPNGQIHTLLSGDII